MVFSLGKENNNLIKEENRLRARTSQFHFGLDQKNGVSINEIFQHFNIFNIEISWFDRICKNSVAIWPFPVCVICVKKLLVWKIWSVLTTLLDDEGD